MDGITQYSEKTYLVVFDNQDNLTFNQGVAGSNPAGLTINLVSKPIKMYPFQQNLVHHLTRESELK